uniref:Leucine-rich repeat-containing N-terminal plant-type domain-containing protein n=1 Tax=Manihot esculenta TaxID=3983 RepID=A0A199UAE6_MANES
MEVMKVCIMVLAMTMVLLFQGVWCSNDCWETERIALLQLQSHFNYSLQNDYYSFQNNPYLFFYDYSIEIDIIKCCDWERVRCSATTGHVIQLNLMDIRDFSLETWYLNASLFLPFQHLNYLDLSGNYIAGYFKNEGFQRLSSLENLKFLNLGFNNFNNNILSSLTHLSSLKYLYLDYNLIKGRINIKELNSFTNLKSLSIGGNEIEGFNSFNGGEKLLNMDNLEFLGMHYNYLENGVISSLTGLFSLKILWMDYNQLKGSFNLKELDTLSNLEVLSLSGNNITKFVSSKGGEDLSNMSNLEFLDMSFNNLENDVLSSLRSLSFLKTLWMNYNQFEGPFDLKGICKLKYLQMLNISHNDLSGNLPLCLVNLTSLRQLDLSSNHFTGNISSSPLEGLTNLEYLSVSDNLFQIPISLSPIFNHSKLKYVESRGNKIFAETNDQYLNPRFQLEKLVLSSGGYGEAFPKFLYHQHDLQFIDLSHIQMSEGFPYWLLQNNTKLEKLYLINNSLSGSLKLPIHSHMNLSVLDISDNFFQGFITPEIGTYLPKLSHLNMSGNGFSGSIPSSFGNMSLLERLDLSNNRLSGTIPEDLTIGCVSLQELILSNNSLQGQIFSETSNLRFLYELQLDDNQFTGSIPHSLSNSSFLEVLDLSHNNLYGRIPRWLGNMYFLRVLDLSMNNISGSLPSNFCPSIIQEIYLSRNGLQGSLEDAFYGCSELTVLDLGHNHMTGSIPSWIGKFSRLSYLILGHNYIDGEIPVQLCNLTQLSLLDLSHNHLFGPILPCLRSTSKTYRQQEGSYNASTEPLEFTTKSISYSYQGRMLSYISGIDLSCNHLTGQIPIEIGYLNEIHVLNLSHNSLTGKIPASFSNLRQIESLDLSYNNLEGNIPPQLTELTFLEVFNVSYNNLSGRTLDKVAQFGTFDESSYRGNPFLCGWPLPRNCTEMVSPPSKSRTSIENEESNGFMDMGVFYISFGVAYSVVLLTIAAVLYINPYWRRVWFYFIEASDY